MDNTSAGLILALALFTIIFTPWIYQKMLQKYVQSKRSIWLCLLDLIVVTIVTGILEIFLVSGVIFVALAPILKEMVMVSILLRIALSIGLFYMVFDMFYLRKYKLTTKQKWSVVMVVFIISTVFNVGISMLSPNSATKSQNSVETPAVIELNTDTQN